MKAHVIENGVVVNTIVVDSLDAFPNLVEATEGGIGWTYADGVFSPPMPNLEVLSAAAVAKRQQLLEASDWTQLPDAPVNKEAWAVYRQALRDITTQVGYPTEINWPVSPT